MTTVHRVLSVLLLVVAALVLFAGGWMVGRTGIGTVVEPSSLTEAERRFAESMRGASLVGTFTLTGDEQGTQKPDRYDIESVQKVGDDLWQFNATMSCCGFDGSSAVPVVVPMRWIGDTPVILMTDTSLPGIGTFTVRLLFYSDHYAGFWQHGTHVGHMTGRIERPSR
jgi:hypothetical protein